MFFTHKKILILNIISIYMIFYDFFLWTRIYQPNNLTSHEVILIHHPKHFLREFASETFLRECGSYQTHPWSSFLYENACYFYFFVHDYFNYNTGKSLEVVRVSVLVCCWYWGNLISLFKAMKVVYSQTCIIYNLHFSCITCHHGRPRSKQAHMDALFNICILQQVACVLMFYLQKDDFPVDTHVRKYLFVIITYIYLSLSHRI